MKILVDEDNLDWLHRAMKDSIFDAEYKTVTKHLSDYLGIDVKAEHISNNDIKSITKAMLTLAAALRVVEGYSQRGYDGANEVVAELAGYIQGHSLQFEKTIQNRYLNVIYATSPQSDAEFKEYQRLYTKFKGIKP